MPPLSLKFRHVQLHITFCVSAVSTGNDLPHAQACEYTKDKQSLHADEEINETCRNRLDAGEFRQVEETIL